MRYTSQYWIRAEMNKLNHYPQNGHCYPDLLDRDDHRVRAQIRATLWKSSYERINKLFQQTLGESLKDGIKILFKAKVNFDPMHGLTLQITDIDPQYTLGDLERQKLETLRRIDEDGLTGKNKSLPLSVLPKRLAIISVETSKGYADFLSKIEEEKTIDFFYMLFPALLQGENAVQDIVKAMRKIKRVESHFDAVVILRGGGGDVGLSAFNHYELAFETANFPLPVLTGIGHRANNTVTEMVAHTAAITPTDIAVFLINRCTDYRDEVVLYAQKISDWSKQILITPQRTLELQTQRMLLNVHTRIHNERLSLMQSDTIARQSSASMLSRQMMLIDQIPIKLKRAAAEYLRSRWASMGERKKDTENLHPYRVLQRGYSITRVDGFAIRSTLDLLPNSVITTELLEGIVESRIIKIKKKTKK